MEKGNLLFFFKLFFGLGHFSAGIIWSTTSRLLCTSTTFLGSLLGFKHLLTLGFCFFKALLLPSASLAFFSFSSFLNFSSSSFFAWLSFFSCSALISFLFACFSFSFFSSSSSFSLVFLHSFMYSFSCSLSSAFLAVASLPSSADMMSSVQYPLLL